ncbi:uncharacterized protein LOC122856457 [Aphidius gifuensis]|uniref:uncharacterized protein LOC122856457 n=1 Tax=Aphidius gifuensis TaxID=684658 RepID=UPI001CDD489C|nr:uncharacterized protein LOC122856457 [Aphidius gifuensis]
MSHLTTLSIEWGCENSTLPMTLAKSLEQIGGTLKSLDLSFTVNRNNIFLPDSLASVFPRLTTLKYLTICGFGLSQLLLQSIGEIKNLTDLKLLYRWQKHHPMMDLRINMYPIGYLKNLEKLHIFCDYGVRDEFLINLCNNAKKLKDLQIVGTNITDIGMSAIDNLQELEFFYLVCQNWKNGFLTSCFTKYTFENNKNVSLNELYETANDPEYLINLCGTYLTHLDVRGYPLSQIMPIINANCPNLETLYSGFKEIMSQDFENVFSNMSHLRKLFIEWECENSTLPMTLVKSLKQIGGTLESLELSCPLDRYDIFLPDSLASVFPRLIALEFLCIRHLGLSQLLLQSIGEMKNLVDLRLMFAGEKDHPMFDKKVNMYPIGNLKNLEKLYILYDYGVTDEFLINLCNNAKKLEDLHIIGINITDIGMSAIDNLQELKFFFLGLCILGSQSEKNEYITDESIQCLFNQKLISLDISNCINVTDKGVIKLVKNLPTLDTLSIRNTKSRVR